MTILKRKHITNEGSVPPSTLLRSHGGHATHDGAEEYCPEGELLLVVRAFLVKAKDAGSRTASVPLFLTLWRGSLWYVSPWQTMLSVEATQA